MRMIGVGLLAFLLAGAAIAISYLDFWQRGWQQIEALADDRSLVFEGREPPYQAPAGTPTVAALRVEPEGAMILSGFPAYQSAEFLLPISARPLAGELRIDATVQAVAGAEGAMRVSVNGTRRGELLLHPGRSTSTLLIPLLPEELAGERVAVTFSLAGASPLPPCGLEAASPVVVEVESSSRLDLTLDRPLEDARDRVLTWGRQVRVGWADRLPAGERERRLALAADLARRGLPVSFVSTGDRDGLDTEALRTLVASDFARPGDAEATWPVPVAADGANAGARRFVRGTTWRTRYEASAMPGGTYPSALGLSLVLGPLPDAEAWTVTATLNGRLVHTERATAGALSRHIPLPQAAQAAANAIEVSAFSSHDPEGVCNGGPELVAEMTAASVLYGGGKAFSDGLTALHAALAGHDTIHVEVGAATVPADAALAARLIASAAPRGMTPRPGPGDGRQVRARIIRPDAPLDAGSAAEQWLVWSEGAGFAPTAARLDAALAARLAGRIPLAVLIDLPGARTTDQPS
jgi:hypothetical protein